MMRGLEIPPQTRKDRVVGASTEEQAAILDVHRQYVNEQNRSNVFENEREKTAEELIMIARSEKNVNALRARYGLEPIRVSPEHFKIIAADHATIGDDLLKNSGGYHSVTESIVVTDAEEVSRKGIGRLDTIQHESIHKGQYQSLGLIRNEARVSGYRMGVEIEARRIEDGTYPHYLSALNEAITEENSRRLVVGLSDSDPEFSHIVAERKQGLASLKKYTTEKGQGRDGSLSLDEDEIMQVRIDTDTTTPQVVTFAYFPERQAMWQLLDKIYERNPDAFPHQTQADAREVMFDMLTRASLDGNILPFGRLMNDTFGSGAFRNYGHLKTIQEVISLTESL